MALLVPQLGFIGAGQMAQALAAGLAEQGLVDPSHVIASDPQQTSRDAFAKRLPGALLTSENAQVLKAADVVFLAVKPQQVPHLLTEIQPLVTPEHLLISIAAGIPLKTLEAPWQGQIRCARVMPNTPCLVGLSASGYALNHRASSADADLVHQLLSAVGIAYRLDESLLDAVTGLAGSGPAFVYTVIEALSDAGVRQGLPRPVAAGLAIQTVRGAAEMVHATGEHPALLRDRVASPGGTTIAGLEALEAAGLRTALQKAVEAATLRSMELGSR